MLKGLLRMEEGDQVFPFIQPLFGSLSTFLWHHDIPQWEGGEQGDPLMPMLFALGQHGALEAVHWRLRDEKLFAFSDDTHVVCTPDRVADVRSSNVTHTSICTRARPSVEQ